MIIASVITSRHIVPPVRREHVVPAIAAVVAIGGQATRSLGVQVEVVEATGGTPRLDCLATESSEGTRVEAFVDIRFFVGVETVLLSGYEFAIV